MKSLSVWVVQVGENMRLNENSVPMRTGYLVEKLLERGHRVLWWGSAFDHFKKEWLFTPNRGVSFRPGFDFIPLGGLGYKKNISLARFLDHRFISRKFRQIAPTLKQPDVLVVSTPPYDLAYEAACFAKDRGLPFLVDIRDPWPDLFVDHFPKPLHWLARIFLLGERRQLQKALRQANVLFSVTEEMLAWALSLAGRKKSPVDQVMGLGFSTFVGMGGTVSEILKEKAELWKDKFVVLFVGTISPSYHNPSILVTAARLLKSTNLHFVIAGDGEGLGEIQRQSAGLSNLTVTGWLNRTELAFVLRRAHVGVCPSAIPLEIPSNKFFAYLSAGLPVISSFGGEIHKTIVDESVGLVYAPGNVQDLVESLLRLHLNPELYRLFSANAAKLYREKFDASVIYASYANAVESLAKGIDVAGTTCTKEGASHEAFL